MRRTHRRAIGPRWAGLCLVLAALSPPAAAQLQGGLQGGADGAGYADGIREGRLEGRVDGTNLGRDQELVKAFVDAFRVGLGDVREGIPAALRELASEMAAAQAREQGEREGRRAGRAAAATADGRTVAAPSPPTVEVPPLPVTLDACRPPEPIVLTLASEREVEMHLALLPDEGSGLDYEIPEPRVPSINSLRQRARTQERYMRGEDIDLYAAWYQRGYRHGYAETFHEERRNLSGEKRRRMTAAGTELGRAEAERRLACEIQPAAWREAWLSAHAASWEAAYREAFATASAARRAGPFVVAHAARLLDGNGDGVLEPGEDVVLEAVLENLGREATGDDAGAWRGLRGVEGSGRLGPAPSAGERRELRLVLGPVDVRARVASSVVVRLDPVGSGATNVIAKVARPLALERAEAGLMAQDGALGARVSATVRASATARVPAGVSLRSGDATATVPEVAPGGTASVDLIVPVASATEPVVLGLEGPDGRTWEERRTVPVTDTAALVRLVSGLDAPGPVVAAVRIRLADELERLMATPEALEDPTVPREIRAYAEALEDLPAASRQLFGAEVSRPLRQLADQPDVPRRLRRTVKGLLSD